MPFTNGIDDRIWVLAKQHRGRVDYRERVGLAMAIQPLITLEQLEKVFGNSMSKKTLKEYVRQFKAERAGRKTDVRKNMGKDEKPLKGERKDFYKRKDKKDESQDENDE